MVRPYVVGGGEGDRHRQRRVVVASQAAVPGESQLRWPLRLESVLLLKASVAPVSRVAIDGGRGIDGLMLRMAIRRKSKTLVKI